jgi:hypothetical protein
VVCAYCADDFPILNKAAIDISLLHVSLAPLPKDVRIKQECFNLQLKIKKKSHPIHPESATPSYIQFPTCSETKMSMTKVKLLKIELKYLMPAIYMCVCLTADVKV